MCPSGCTAGRPTTALTTSQDRARDQEKMEVCGYFLTERIEGMMVLGCMDERSGITNWVLFQYLQPNRNEQEASQVRSDRHKWSINNTCTSLLSRLMVTLTNELQLEILQNRERERGRE